MIPFIFTDRVRSTRREVIVSLCHCTPVGGGVPQPGPGRGGGGTPGRFSRGGYPTWLGVPPIRPGQGVPPIRGHLATLGTPHQTFQGGTPPWVPPPIRPGWAGGVPLPGGTPPRVTDGVLDTPRSVLSCYKINLKNDVQFFIFQKENGTLISNLQRNMFSKFT